MTCGSKSRGGVWMRMKQREEEEDEDEDRGRRRECERERTARVETGGQSEWSGGRRVHSRSGSGSKRAEAERVV